MKLNNITFSLLVVFNLLVFECAFSQTSKKKIDKQLINAIELDENGKTIHARELLLNIYKKDSLYHKTNFIIGIHYFINSFDKKDLALNYFSKAYIVAAKDSILDYVFYLAEAEKFNEEYDKAILHLEECLAILRSNKNEYFIKDEEIKSKIIECKLAKEQISNDSNLSNIQQLDTTVNSNYSDYSPIYLNSINQLVYCSRKTPFSTKKKDEYDNKYFEDIYIKNNTSLNSTNELSNDLRFANIHNSEFHDGICWGSFNDSIIILYHKNELFLSKLENGKYSAPKNLFTKENVNWRPHASLNIKKRIVYFSMLINDNLDIFKGKLNANDQVEEIENLGQIINSAFDEDSPNYDQKENKLYFSSKNNSIGGYDIFYANLDSNGNVLNVNSLGFPFNSPGDDIYFIKDHKNNDSYFSSFRKGSYGDMDIYKSSLFNDKCNPMLNKSFEITLNAQGSEDPNGAKVFYQWVIDNKTKVNGSIIKHTFNKPGKHVIALNVIDSITSRIEYNEKEIEIDINNVDYLEINSNDTIEVNKATFLKSDMCFVKNDTIINYRWNSGEGQYQEGETAEFSYSKTGTFVQKLVIETKNKNKYQICKDVTVVSKEEFLALNKKGEHSNLIGINFETGKLDSSKAFTNTNNQQSQNLTNNNLDSAIIYFDFDKSKINSNYNDLLEQLAAEIIKKKLNITITASCDSRGSDKYNLGLSFRRANSVYRFLLKNGVDKKNIKGLLNLGETKLYNRCDDNTFCEDNLHKENRRVTIEIKEQ